MRGKIRRKLAGKEIAYSRLKDALRGRLMGHGKLHKRFAKHLEDQKKHWDGAYVQGYFYQGLEELGISGAKPTGHRFRQYEVDDILTGATVLDIGCNTGFVAAYCAKFAKRVVGVELNPYLVKIAEETAEYLGRDNLEFIVKDFSDFQTSETFDVVLSLSNHHTIDGNLDMGFEHHIARIAGLLEPDGVMLFESHNVFGPGTGGVGDDGDMDQKMQTITKYFAVERYRMVHKFVTYGDVDKLFLVARKSDAPQSIDFDLNTARTQYSWTRA